jgi:hypothetical protein
MEVERERPDRTPWSDQDRRTLLITIAGGLVANLATVVVVFSGIALIKHVEHCVAPIPPDNNGCFSSGWAPVWPLVWLITFGGALAVVIILAARRGHRHATERVRTTARAAQWAAGFYILGVAIMWVGLASGIRPA